MSKVFDIAGSIVLLAIIAVVVKNKNSASVITAFGNVFTHSLRVAEG